MITSKLSLKKVNNIARQIERRQNDIIDVIDNKDGSKFLKLKSNDGNCKIRDFYEFYINDQSLINIVSKNYWEIDADENVGFFNTHVGCLGSFGKFWDGINVSILTKKEFSKDQIESLEKMFCSDYRVSELSISDKSHKEQLVEDITNGFLLYCCQDCGDFDCGGITFEIKRVGDNMIWTDNSKIEIQFNFDEYKEVLENYLKGKF